MNVNDVDAQASDMEAQIVIALSRYRYVSEISSGRRAKVRQLHAGGTVGPVLWRYAPRPGEEPRIWLARVRDLRALQEQLRIELTLVAAGCPLMLEQIDVELVDVDDARRRARN